MLDVKDFSNEDIFLLLVREKHLTEEDRNLIGIFPYEGAGYTPKRPALPNTRYDVLLKLTSVDCATSTIESMHMLITTVDGNDVPQIKIEKITDPSEGWNAKYGLE